MNNLNNNPRYGRYGTSSDGSNQSDRRTNAAQNNPWDNSVPDNGFEEDILWDADFDDGSFDDEWAGVTASSHSASASQDDFMFDDDFDDDFGDEPGSEYVPLVRQPQRPEPPAARQPRSAHVQPEPAPRSSRTPMPEQRRQPRQSAEPDRSRTQPTPPRRPEKELISKALFAVVALACLLSSYFISSGGLVENNAVSKTQRSAVFDLRQGFDLISSNVVNSINGLPKVYVLPMNESPAPAPNPDGYSSYVDEDGDVHDTYTDETITVDCSRKFYQVGKYRVIAAVARIKISHPTQLRSFFAGGEYSTTVRARPSQMARQANAIVAINGEFYNYASHDDILIRNGTEYRSIKTFTYIDTLFIDSNGDFHIMTTSKAVETGLFETPDYQINHSVFFGPGLVVDGEVVHYNLDEYTIWGSRNPRSAIGQAGPLEYVLVAVEGRSANSKGLSTDFLADFMKELGCTQAYNVDGGQSSMMVFNGKLYNKVSNNNERQFGDIIYFGSALPEDGRGKE